tara:strand:+ start:1045 stop:1317 length:273 start_codon:yes stop_codon:yes gene_type:complete
MEHNTADGGVIVAHWRVTEVDGDYSASSYSTASFTYDASSPDFVPYADLTEEMVLGWCFDGDVDKDAIEASLTANIEEQKNPTTQDGVPW